jgi:hypothetical protein
MKPLNFTILLLIIFSFSFSGNSNAQKIFVPSAQKYVVLDYSDDTKSDLSLYSGSYVYIYPGYDENEQSEGRPYIFTLTIFCNKTGSEFTASRIKQFVGDDPLQNAKLSNPSIVGNNFYSDEITGKFVILKYTKSGTDYSVKGFFKKHKNDSGYDFYERQ